MIFYYDVENSELDDFLYYDFMPPTITLCAGNNGGKRIISILKEKQISCVNFVEIDFNFVGEDLEKQLSQSDALFIVSEIDEYGTGFSPQLAKRSKNMGKLTFGIVISQFERRKDYNEISLFSEDKLRECSDSVCVIRPSHIKNTKPSSSVCDVDNIFAVQIYNSISAMNKILLTASYLNVDFSDFKTILKKSTNFYVFSKTAKNSDELLKKLSEEFSNHNVIGLVQRAIIFLSVEPDFPIIESDNVFTKVTEMCHPDVRIIRGVDLNYNSEKFIQVITIVSDFDDL